MRYTAVLFAFFAAVALAQDEQGPVEEIGEAIGDLTGEGISVASSVLGTATDVAESIDDDDDSDAEEDVEEAEEDLEDAEEDIDEAEEDIEDAEEEAEDAASIAAIPVLGAGIAGALAVVGML